MEPLPQVCWFQNLEGWDPRGESDDVYLACIRRANLDAMLGKSPLMIRAHRRETIAVLENSRLIEKTPAYHPRGPFPLGDPVGMSLAVDMLVKSLVAKGRIADHVQFATPSLHSDLSPERINTGNVRCVESDVTPPKGWPEWRYRTECPPIV